MDVREIPSRDVVEVLAELLDRLGLVVTQSDYGRGIRIGLITKQEADKLAAEYEKEYR